MKNGRWIFISTLALIDVLAVGRAAAQGAAETLQGMLAAQIRSQGFTCDKPLGATKDAGRSRADHGVWVLRCSNASYRVSRWPDMPAKIEPLR
ncbi:hypothetical protein N2603_30060 [Bradyrhizobium huanghuaihaiense]|uniref:hypothetical protein n=1 Tax=Bradyrhizobium huanghuaihaiense TaxID=990078 RepID=UPI0021AB0760|nr:hypothetical protein [Bradyrhizobium sp. CB3035]UWU74284.1 hypothetical protein N2603_30060 [Bradyrhizobium sp. CB3035]